MTTKLVGCFTLLIAPGIAAADEDPMAAAARKRQEFVRTLVVVFKSTNFRTSSSTAPRPAPADPWEAPAEKLTNESTRRLIIDGAKSREDTEFNESLGIQPRPVQTTTVRDGALRKHLQFKGPRASVRATGSIGSDDGKRNFSLPLPLAITFRGLDGAMSYFRLDRLKPTGVVETIDGSTWHEYSFPGGNPGTEFWFEPEKGFVLRRLVTREGERLVRQTDIRYREDKNAGWVPANWTDLECGTGTADRSRSEVEILKVEFNQPQAAEQFDLVFPPGTRVFDNRDNKEYDVAADGTLQVVDKDSTLGRRSDGSPWYMRTRWLSYAVVITLLGLVSVLYLFKQLRGKPK
jgi:hypothetical protein